ncbi:MAG: proline--tRNA ligase [Holosporales bacterium]|jgi:prolyl-tRNA synthetase|nr:proline--tRNA ligase [Holosporales bacterium]
MKISDFFIQTFREAPAEAQVISHRLMLRSGLIYQTCNGIYTWMPLGLKVLSKIEAIIAYEQNKIGCNRILMPTIQPANFWIESGRYNDYGKEMLRIKDRHDKDLLYGPTHEEVVTDLARRFIKSYRQLPTIFYQISWKFRDEIRPRFGVMRGREFLMKDGYSFDIDQKSAINSYKKIFFSYLKTFKRIGLKPIPICAASGAIGGNLSHEFHIEAKTGESEIFYDYTYDEIDAQKGIENVAFEEIEKIYTAADEKHNSTTCKVPPTRLKSSRGIEVGHIFYFGRKYSESMNLVVAGKDGHPFFPEMGSYGIGVSRLVAAVIEANHDEYGIIWPDAVAPFKVVIITTQNNNEQADTLAERLYQKLLSANVDVLFDNRSERAGVKFSDMDLIGIPHQIIIGAESVKNGNFEWKERRSGIRSNLTFDETVSRAAGI